MKQSKHHVNNAIMKNVVASNARIVIGYIIAIPFGLFGVMGSATTHLAESMDVIMVSLLFFIASIGVFQVVGGKRSKRFILLFKEYAARLAKDPDHSIAKLAAATGAAFEKVKKNVLKMIQKGYFVNAYIDFGKNCIVFAYEGELYKQNSAFPQQADSPEGYFRVICTGCGAKNKVQKGTVGECEFCGNYLSE